MRDSTGRTTKGRYTTGEVTGIAAASLAILNGQLAGHTFIIDDTLTMADIAVGTLLYRYYTMPITRPSLPNVEAYYARLTARKAYQDHVMIDWISMKIPGA